VEQVPYSTGYSQLAAALQTARMLPVLPAAPLLPSHLDEVFCAGNKVCEGVLLVEVLAILHHNT
jgi:hypothetical protein